jgi:hypothetical protein
VAGRSGTGRAGGLRPARDEHGGEHGAAQGTRANALRHARLCYDHLAGQLGVSLMTALVEGGVLDGGDGGYHPETARTDRLSAPGHDVGYKLTGRGATLIGDFGVDLAGLRAGRRPLIRYCLDWTEQRHHLAGALGAGLAGRLFELGWVCHAPSASRAVQLTGEGRVGLAATFGVRLDDDAKAQGDNGPYQVDN